jgi:small-conductance mechanosensitive channel
MQVERRLLKSISEFSVFKYVLVAYLIFFILFVIIFAIIGLIGWAVLASSGMTLEDVLNSVMPGMDISQVLGTVGINIGGGIIGIIIFIIVGLVASVFAAALAALVTWILNVILRIVGGIELRFATDRIIRENTTINVHTPGTAQEKNEKVYQNYDLNKEQ